MDGKELITELLNNSGFVTFICLLASFVKIPKVEVNVWGLIGKFLTKGVSDKIDNLEDSIKKVDNKLDEHIKLEEEREATTSRQRILRFNDEIINGANHSREHYEDMIQHIDTYEKFCADYPDYQNNKCKMAIANIKETYHKKCMEKIESKPKTTRKKKEEK